MADGANSHVHRFGSLFSGTPVYDAEVRKKAETFGFLDRVCQALEPTETQMARAKRSYEAVGEWLCGDVSLVNALIYAQGSAAIGTMVRPLDRSEHDVDLICRHPSFSSRLSPAVLKRIVGDRLKSHAHYASILEEKQRCWRLNYVGDFHLDVTPSIFNPDCTKGGELVPDRTLQAWKPSNPTGYRNLFAYRASLQPAIRVVAKADSGARAEIQPFPASAKIKGVLRRTVQLLKRHRDIEFRHRDRSLAPLSIVITTLASKAYEYCVKNHEYDNELDLLCDIIRAMTWFIEKDVVQGRIYWRVVNETTEGENFAEKWNKDDGALALAFFGWHSKALTDFETLKAIAGLDAIQMRLSGILGEEPIRKAVFSVTEEVNVARKSGSLLIQPGLGLTTSAASFGVPVRRNTFFGQ